MLCAWEVPCLQHWEFRLLERAVANRHWAPSQGSFQAAVNNARQLKTAQAVILAFRL